MRGELEAAPEVSALVVRYNLAGRVTVASMEDLIFAAEADLAQASDFHDVYGVQEWKELVRPTELVQSTAASSG